MNNDRILEQLSAFADGELPKAEAELLMARLARDPELRRAWERYHVCGESMRRALAGACAPGFAARVAGAIEREDAHAARRMARWARPVAGGAIAATVALFAVLGIRSQVAGPGGEVVPGVAGTGTPLAGARAVDFDPQQAELEAKLNSYLLDHGTTAGRRLQGVMPLVHVTTHEAPAAATTADAAKPAAPDARAAAKTEPKPETDADAGRAKPAERPRP